MATCPNCNAQINSTGSFCVNCGANLVQVSQASVINNGLPNQSFQGNSQSKLHCPNCKSHNISISTESSVDGAISTYHGGFSSTHVSNTHRNYWFCSDCGTKFRNIQNLEEELQKAKNRPIVSMIISIICAIIAVVLGIKMTSSVFGFMFIGLFVGFLVAAIVFFCYIFVYSSRVKKLRQELQYLSYNCFN